MERRDSTPSNARQAFRDARGKLIPFLLFASACFQSGCVRPYPADVRLERSIAARRLVEEASVVIAATPVTSRVIDRWARAVSDDGTKTTLVLWEVELQVHIVLKGQAMRPGERVKFRQYTLLADAASPNSGPVACLQCTALFFLEATPVGGYRTLVDQHRTELPLSWLRKENAGCNDRSAEDCLARILLSASFAEDQDGFRRQLPANLTVSIAIIGYGRTRKVIKDVLSEEHDATGHRFLCETVTRSRPYALAPFEECEEDVRVLRRSAEYRDLVSREIAEIRSQGFGGIKSVTGSHDEEIHDFLRLIERSKDSQVADLARALLK